MYKINIINNGNKTAIQDETEKLKSGNVVKGINSIDSFSFSLLPSNAGYNRIYDYVTLVSVFNTNKNRYEFQGRVLYSYDAMDEDGSISKEVTCESFLGFLCDSKQNYVEEQNWTVEGLLQHVLDVHNSQVEDYKHFAIGNITVEDENDNLYVGIQKDTTWDTIKKKLIDKLGGEIQFRVVDGKIYLDYLKELGYHSTTEIALSKNMKSIQKEDDPTAYITRLRPWGNKLKKEITTVDANGNETTQFVETEERLDITSVNNGLNYIDDEEAIAVYGIHVGDVEWDDVTVASNLLTKGKEWLAENNKVKIKYSVTALDLSLLELDIDDFNVCNYHPLKNKLLGIDDTARIIKKKIDVCEEVKSTIEFGDSFKTNSDLQIEQKNNIDSAVNTVKKIESDYITNEMLVNETIQINSLIQQVADNITLGVEKMTSDSISGLREEIAAQLTVMADEIALKFTETTAQIENVNGDLQEKYNTITKYFSFDINGLTIGQIDNPYKVVIDNDRYSMLVNGVEVLWIANGEVYAPEITVTKKLDMFGFLVGQDEYGNINCEYVGGGE